MSRHILHVDMDAFFASVEQRDNPELRGRPVLVGGGGRRGVVAAASYEARRFGARSAMATVHAKRLCPDAIIVPPRHAHYAAVSREVFAIFARYSPQIEGISFDEAFIDVTGSVRLFGAPEGIAERIRGEIRERLCLTASAGVATSKFVAKIASERNKPDGLCVVPAGTEATFLSPMPVRAMWGVGPKAAERLRQGGFTTIGDIASADPEVLEARLGHWAETAQRLARGQDDRPVVTERAAKSIGAEETFEKDLASKDELRRALLSQCERVAARLVAAGLCAGSLTVKIKFADFTARTRQLSLPHDAADTDSLFEAACALLDRFADLNRGVRLTGVSASDLREGQRSLLLFEDEAVVRRRQLQDAVHAVRERFGAAGVTRASLLDARPGSVQLRRVGDESENDRNPLWERKPGGQ